MFLTEINFQILWIIPRSASLANLLRSWRTRRALLDRPQLAN